MRVKSLIFLVVLVLIASMAAGCGGASQSGGQGDGDQAKKTEKTQKKKKPKAAARETETVTGVVTRVDVENRRFVVRPKDKEPVLLIFNPKSIKVTLNGKGAKPDDIKEKQQAEAKYFTKKDKKIALFLDLESSE